MKIAKIVPVVVVLAFVIALPTRTRITPKPSSPTATGHESAPAPALARNRSTLDMSSDAQARVREACKQAVSADSGLKLHRRGRFGLRRDRILLYSWGDMFMSERNDVGEYQMRSFVDTVIDDTGNVHRTPYICAVRNDFVVLSLGFGEIAFPPKNPFAAGR